MGPLAHKTVGKDPQPSLPGRPEDGVTLSHCSIREGDVLVASAGWDQRAGEEVTISSD